jgi:DNA-binding transcriptional LysR family regulator
MIVPSSMAGLDAHTVLAADPFIRYGCSFWGGRLVNNFLTQAGIRPRERFELSTLDAIAVMVDRGLGVLARSLLVTALARSLVVSETAPPIADRAEAA